jgi:hypothetical protein
MLDRMDHGLTQLLANAQPVPGFAARVHARITHSTRHPQAIPELLDFVGWSAILLILAVVAEYGASYWGASSILVLSAVASLFLAMAIAVGLRSQPEPRRLRSGQR